MNIYDYLTRQSLRILRELGRERDLEEELYQDFLFVKGRVKNIEHYKMFYRNAMQVIVKRKNFDEAINTSEEA